MMRKTSTSSKKQKERMLQPSSVKAKSEAAPPKTPPGGLTKPQVKLSSEPLPELYPGRQKSRVLVPDPPETNQQVRGNTNPFESSNPPNPSSPTQGQVKNSQANVYIEMYQFAINNPVTCDHEEKMKAQAQEVLRLEQLLQDGKRKEEEQKKQREAEERRQREEEKKRKREEEKKREQEVHRQIQREARQEQERQDRLRLEYQLQERLRKEKQRQEEEEKHNQEEQRKKLIKPEPPVDSDCDKAFKLLKSSWILILVVVVLAIAIPLIIVYSTKGSDARSEAPNESPRHSNRTSCGVSSGTYSPAGMASPLAGIYSTSCVVVTSVWQTLGKSPLDFLSKELSKFSSAALIFATRDLLPEKSVAADFHKACDNVPNVLVIIKSGQYIAGGFTSVAFEAREKGGYKPNTSGSTFLYSINKQKIYALKIKEYAVGCEPYSGPKFGILGLTIYDNYQVVHNSESIKNRGSSFYDSTASEGELFGSEYFTIDEYEVYKLE